MSDADRTPEDVPSDGLRQRIEDAHAAWFHDGRADSLLSDRILNDLAAAGFAVVPAADVDAATRLRAAIKQHRCTRSSFPLRADELLWEAAAAVGSVNPEGGATSWSTIACPEHGDHCRGEDCCCADKHPPLRAIAAKRAS